MFNLGSIRSLIILLLSTSFILETSAQVHRDSCFNSALKDESIKEATKDQYKNYGNCFSVEIFPFKEPRTFHITFYFDLTKSNACKDLRQKFGTVEVMARGNFEHNVGTRFPLGQMTRENQWNAPCRPWPHEPDPPFKYHIEYQTVQEDITCDPPVIRNHNINPGEMDLSDPNYPPIFYQFNWDDRNRPQIPPGKPIIACVLWTFDDNKLKKKQPRLYMDFTAEIQVMLPGDYKYTMLHIGLRQVQINLGVDFCSQRFDGKGKVSRGSKDHVPKCCRERRPDYPIAPPTTTTKKPIITTTTTKKPIITTTSTTPKPIITTTSTTSKPIITTTSTTPKPTTTTTKAVPTTTKKIKTTSEKPTTEAVTFAPVTDSPKTDDEGDKWIYDGCNFSKGCIGDGIVGKKSSCLESRNCILVVTYGKGKDENARMDETVIEMYGLGPTWIAMGLSINKGVNCMGDDLVIECVKEANEIKVYTSWNWQSPFRNNTRLQGKQSSNVQLINSTYDTLYHPDFIYCKFSIHLEFKVRKPGSSKYVPQHEFDLGKDARKDEGYYIIMARGHEITGFGPRGNIKGHPTIDVSNRGRFVAFQAVALYKRVSPYEYQEAYLKHHGMLMTIGGIFFLPQGIYYARYMKNPSIIQKVRGIYIWKLVHIFCMVIAFVCIVGGTSLHLLGMSGWSGAKSYFHKYGGGSCIALMLFGIISGWFVKEPTIAQRETLSFFAIIHGISGHLAYFCAGIICMSSETVAFSYLPCLFGELASIWVTFSYVMLIFMSFQYSWVNFLVGKTRRVERMPFSTVLTQRIPEPKIEPIHKPIRKRRMWPTHIKFDTFPRERDFNKNGCCCSKCSKLINPLSPRGTIIRLVCAGIFTGLNTLYVCSLVYGIYVPKPCYTFNDYLLFSKLNFYTNI